MHQNINHLEINQVLTHFGLGDQIILQNELNNLAYIMQQACSVKAVDTTAAGDTFTGYFVAADAACLPPQKCLRLATHAAAIAVSRPGAAPSIPVMAEIKQFSC